MMRIALASLVFLAACETSRPFAKARIGVGPGGVRVVPVIGVNDPSGVGVAYRP